MTAIQTAAVAPLKVYIAGKITGDPEYKRKFLSAHMEQKNEGHIVLNPAHLPEGMKNADYMGRMGAPLTEELLSMPVITDVDGGRWRPVNEDALQEAIALLKERQG